MALGIQRPDTMFIAGEARDNTRVACGDGAAQIQDAAIMMFNDAVAGTRLQPGIKGRGTVQLPDGSFREMQAFYTPRVPATQEQAAALSDHERAILTELRNVDSFWPRRVVNSALRGFDPEDDEQQMSFKTIRESPIVLASDRPDLDPLSDQYVRPMMAFRRPTMDDDHVDSDSAELAEPPPTVRSPAGVGKRRPLGDTVDGFDDDYLPTVDDEYGPPIPVAAKRAAHMGIWWTSPALTVSQSGSTFTLSPTSPMTSKVATGWWSPIGTLETMVPHRR